MPSFLSQSNTLLEKNSDYTNECESLQRKEATLDLPSEDIQMLTKEYDIDKVELTELYRSANSGRKV